MDWHSWCVVREAARKCLKLWEPTEAVLTELSGAGGDPLQAVGEAQMAAIAATVAVLEAGYTAEELNTYPWMGKEAMNAQLKQRAAELATWACTPFQPRRIDPHKPWLGMMPKLERTGIGLDPDNKKALEEQVKEVERRVRAEGVGILREVKAGGIGSPGMVLDVWRLCQAPDLDVALAYLLP